MVQKKRYNSGSICNWFLKKVGIIHGPFTNQRFTLITQFRTEVKVKEDPGEAPTSDEALIAAGVYSMTTWLAAALLANPTVALQALGRMQGFVTAYLQSSCKRG